MYIIKELKLIKLPNKLYFLRLGSPKFLVHGQGQIVQSTTDYTSESKKVLIPNLMSKMQPLHLYKEYFEN